MFLLQVHKITLHIEITCKLGHRCLFLMVRYYSWYTCSGVLTKKLAPVCTQEWGGGCTCIQVNLTPWWTVVMVFIYMKWCHLVNKVILHWCKQLNLLSYLNSSQTTDYSNSVKLQQLDSQGDRCEIRHTTNILPSVFI